MSPGLLSLLISLLMMSLRLIIIVISSASAAEEHFRPTSSEESSKNVIRVELIFTEVLLIALREVLFRPMLIIYPALVGVAQTCERRTYLLECICGIRGSVLIWMELQCELFISLLDVIFAGTFGNT